MIEDIPDLVILDVDGVLTDGTKFYEKGYPTGKFFCDRDFTAIKLMQVWGVDVCFMTADKLNQKVAADRNIDCFVSRDGQNRITKVETLEAIKENYYPPEKPTIFGRAPIVWGIGDDLFDWEWLAMCNKSFCPADAAAFLTVRVDEILWASGGQGVVMEMIERFFPEPSQQVINNLIERDSREKWSSTAR